MRIIFSKPLEKSDFIRMCIEEAPVEIGPMEPFEEGAVFEQVKILIDSVYKKFQIIKFLMMSEIFLSSYR